MDIKKNNRLPIFSRIGNTKQGILIYAAENRIKGGGKLEAVTWNVFASTGKVEDYLYYKGKKNDIGIEQKKEVYCSEQTSEEAVWEEPLR